MRSHLKKKILVQYRGGTEFPRVAGFPVCSYPRCGSQPSGILPYFEDLKRGANKKIGTKGFFKIASILAAILLLSGYISNIAADVTPDVTRISIEDAKSAHARTDVQFIDVRTARTWWKSGNKIEKATREDPSRVDEWAHKYNKKTTLIFY